MPRLTKKLIETTPATGKDYIIFDDELSGFGLRLLPSGRKVFIIQYRAGRRPRRLTIGPYPILTPETARIEATAKLAAIRSGEDPMAKKKAYMASPTVRDLAKRYLNEHCQVHLKASTQKGNKYLVNEYILPELGNFKVVDVDRSDIANLHSSLADVPVIANRVLATVSKMYNLAELWGWRQDNTNPARRIKKFPERKRDKFLGKKETLRLGLVLQEQKLYPDENHAAIYAIQLLLLTGCRLREILHLKWEYVDLEEGYLHLPDSKTGAKKVYLGEYAVNLLREINASPMRPVNNPHVIWGTKAGQPLVNLYKPWRRYCRIAKLDQGLRIHDLRHTFASFAVNQQLGLSTIGELLGQSQTHTTARYAHLMDDPMKEALPSEHGVEQTPHASACRIFKNPDAFAMAFTNSLLGAANAIGFRVPKIISELFGLAMTTAVARPALLVMAMIAWPSRGENPNAD